jgi:L-lactate dehydrogenase complex protein LldF
MADLALMLELLPRSATGQKISVYVSLIHGPRGANETDGPRERHLILIDNGRSALRQSPFAEALYCIRCGACLNACPVFREIGGHAYVGDRGQPAPYPGPIGSIISSTLFGVPDFGHLAQASTLCGACRDACPVDIDLPKLILRLRARTEDGRSASPMLPRMVRGGLRLYSWLACNSGRFAVTQKVASALGRILSPHSEWLRLPGWTGWGLSRDFPRPSANAKRLPKPQKPSEASSPNAESLSSSPAPKQGDFLQQFTDELAALGGSVTRCAPETLGENLLRFLQDRGFNEIFAWEDDHLPAGLTAALRKAGIRLVTAPQPDVQVGLTGSLGAVASSGTLVVPSAPGQPASASLLPEIHLAILEAKHIYPHLIDILTLPQIREHSAVALISGPSRTADIEMTLTIGVHGPREVHLFVI